MVRDQASRTEPTKGSSGISYAAPINTNFKGVFVGQESLKKTSETTKESQTSPSTPSAPSSGAPGEKAKTQAPSTPATPESKVIPIKGDTPSEKKESGCS